MLSLLSLIVSIVTAVATGAIAWAGLRLSTNQDRRAEIELRDRLFDRRFEVFKAVRELLRACLKNPNFNLDVIRTYTLDTLDAAFFFSSTLVDYLESLRNRAIRLSEAALIVDTGKPEDDVVTAIRRKTDLMNEFVRDIENLVARFEPEMGLHPNVPEPKVRNDLMNSAQRWLLRAVAVASALTLPFYFLQFGPADGYHHAIFVVGQSEQVVAAPGVTFTRLPDGVLARVGYSRDAAALGGILIPVLLLIGAAYDVLRSRKT